jgi:CrcB protein
MNLYSILIVGSGGFLGSIFRYIISLFVDKKFGSPIPYGTLTVNILGSFVMGIVIGVASRQAMPGNNWKVFLTTGFCGGFTTFSAFAFENVNLIQQRLVNVSLLYSALSIVLGFAAMFAGIALGRSMNS